jgi:hypothetical protein
MAGKRGKKEARMQTSISVRPLSIFKQRDPKEELQQK